MPIWKPIPGWEHRYEVSSDGQVRSKDSRVNAGKNGSGIATRKGRVLKPVQKSGRYLCVTLADGARREQRFIHDIVAEVFIGPKPNGMETRHLDDVRSNNTVTNIRYGTHRDNEDDRMRNGRVPRGERHGCAKLTEEQVRAIRCSNEPPSSLSQRYSVTSAHIHAVRTRRVWCHI